MGTFWILQTCGLSMYHTKLSSLVSSMKYLRRNFPLFSFSSMSRKLKFTRNSNGIAKILLLFPSSSNQFLYYFPLGNKKPQWRPQRTALSRTSHHSLLPSEFPTMSSSPLPLLFPVSNNVQTY